MPKNLSLVFVRRGYSPTGGAEAYLKRLARGVIEAGHDVQLVATSDWPDGEWPFGSIAHLRSKSPVEFASELERMRAQFRFDVLFSLERVWSCDVYRAGDGVHRAWLERRRKFELPLKRFVRSLSSKHQDLLRLEQSLFSGGNAKRVIAGSQMVKDEVVNIYGYPADKIDIVRNGVPLKKFQFGPELREKSREEFRICEYAVRSIASPISSAMAFRRFCKTATVIGSVMLRSCSRRLSPVVVSAWRCRAPRLHSTTEATRCQPPA